MGGSPGLVVMGDDSCLRGHGFESQHSILDGPFKHWFVIKIYYLFEKTKNKWKRSRGRSIFFKKKESLQSKHSGKWPSGAPQTKLIKQNFLRLIFRISNWMKTADCDSLIGDWSILPPPSSLNKVWLGKLVQMSLFSFSNAVDHWTSITLTN